MKKNDRYLLFLNNHYEKNDFDFYRRRISGAVTVAVDGGIRFFMKKKIKPDILIGDLDSAPRLSKKYLDGIELITFPSRKDKTDSQLALELALSRGADRIEIFGAIGHSEIDHTLGNIFLLELVNKFNRDNHKKIAARIIGPNYELAMLENGSAEFVGRQGDYLSVIPLSASPKISYAGLIYSAPQSPLRIGHTLSLRNQLKSPKAKVKIVGKAIVTLIRS
jgi:thiamine pyrophosphokinase